MRKFIYLGLALFSMCTFALMIFTLYYLVNMKVFKSNYWDQLAATYYFTIQLFFLINSLYAMLLLLTHQAFSTLAQLLTFQRQQAYKSYYVYLTINSVYLLAFAVIVLVDPSTITYDRKESYRFILGFYVCALFYYFTSKELFSRTTLTNNEQIIYGEGVLRCGYEIFYYVFTFFIIFAYIFSVAYKEMLPYQTVLGQFFIQTLIYLFYSITKVAILFNIFTTFGFTRILVLSISFYFDEDQPKTRTLLAFYTVVILVSLFFLKMIISQILRGVWTVISLYNGQYNSESPPDYLTAINGLPMRREPVAQEPQRDYLHESEINQLDIIKYSSEQSLKQLEDKDKKEKSDAKIGQNQLEEGKKEELRHETDPIIEQEYNHHHDAPQFNIEIKQKKANTEQIAHRQSIPCNRASNVCAICDSDLLKDQKVIRLKCKHLFHYECLESWLKRKNSCPYCRQKPYEIRMAP